MARAAVDRLFLAIVEAETLGEAEEALEALAAFDAADPSAALEHEPLGDLYSELATECFEEEETDEAVRLQTLALEHPCTNRRREQGKLLGYRFVGLDDQGALDDLKASRSGSSSDASLLSGFAEQAEFVELSLAIRLHDEALEVAKAAKPADETLLRGVVIARALARADAEFPPDEDDLLADTYLDELERADQLAEAREARQLFVPRDQLEAARAAWPEAESEWTSPSTEAGSAPARRAIGSADPDPDPADDAYYAGLERRWQSWPPDAARIAPYPVDVALFTSFGVEPTRLVDELPDALVLAIEAAGTGPLAWPPGRNEPCWCGSGRKYKRCCG